MLSHATTKNQSIGHFIRVTCKRTYRNHERDELRSCNLMFKLKSSQNPLVPHGERERARARGCILVTGAFAFCSSFQHSISAGKYIRKDQKGNQHDIWALLLPLRPFTFNTN